MSGRMLVWSLAVVVAAGMVGCSKGEKTFPVKGKVSYTDGTPLKKAQVAFTNKEKGITASGQTNEAGEFTLSTTEPGDGAPPGNYVISVSPDSYEAKQTVAKKFMKGETSGLTFTVKDGENDAGDLKVEKGK